MRNYINEKVYNPAVKLMVENQKRSKAKLDNNQIETILNWYNEYKDFMKWDTRCTYDLKPFDSSIDKKDYFAQVDHNTIKLHANKDICDIEIDIHIFNILKDSCKSVLFHEFTHIYDHELLYPYMMNLGVESAYSWLTEAHAKEVELMCLLNFDSIKKTCCLNLSTIMSNVDGNPSIHKYFNVYVDFLLKLKKEGDYFSLLKEFQYFLGMTRFLVKQLCKEQDGNRILNTAFNFSKLMGDKDLIISKSIIFEKTDDSSLLEIEEELKKIRNNIYKRKMIHDEHNKQ